MNADLHTPAEPEILAKAWPAAAPAERTLAKGLAGRQCSEERPYAPRCSDERPCIPCFTDDGECLGVETI